MVGESMECGDGETYERRALAAYCRTDGTGHRAVATLPHVALCVRHGDRHYVVLGAGPGTSVRAVYRIKTSGTLRRLKRWPKAVEAAAGLTE